MKEIKKYFKNLTPKDILSGGLLIFLCWLILAALTYWKISPYTYNEFDTTCQHFSYTDCMRWFYTTKPYFEKVTIISLSLALISIITTLIFYFKRKNGKK